MQVLANGLVSGLVLGLLALAFAIVYLPTRILFLALAGIYALAPYLQMQFVQWGCPQLLGTILTLLSCAGLSVLCEIFNHKPLERRGAGDGSHFVSSLGIYLALVQIIVMIWGTGAQMQQTTMPPASRYGGILLTHSQIVAALVSVIAIGATWISLQKTKAGLQMRALSCNARQLAIFGHNTDHLRLLAFACAGILAALSSLLTAADIGFSPHTGLSALLVAVVAVFIGGRQSFLGAIFGAILVGLVRSQVVWHLSPSWQDAITYLLLAVFLLFRPTGIFANRTRAEVSK